MGTREQLNLTFGVVAHSMYFLESLCPPGVLVLDGIAIVNVDTGFWNIFHRSGYPVHAEKVSFFAEDSTFWLEKQNCWRVPDVESEKATSFKML